MKKAWAWIPTLYFAEGLPYVVAMTIAVIMYKNLGMSNTDIAVHTSWLYLPWVIKPFWSPFVDILKTKRWWVIAMQALLALSFAAMAFTLYNAVELDFSGRLTWLGRLTLCVLWVVAFSSATHDIAADGYYMLALDEHEQSLFVGIRSTFYRIASITGQGVLVMLAGFMEKRIGVAMAWSAVFALLAAVFAVVCIYHFFIMPHAEQAHAAAEVDKGEGELASLLMSFFHKKDISIAVLFMLLYRLSEALLAKMSSPFMLDSTDAGGLGLTTEQVGFVYGTVGVICLTAGGIIGGLCIARHGLKFWLWPMALSITMPDIVYVILSQTAEPSMALITTCVGIEQLGYGFGFSAYMMYLIYVARGEHKTSHYAFCTGIMALGMMLPGMAAGWLQTALGYQNFFILVMICTIPTLLLLPLLKIDPDFGKKLNSD